MLDIEKKIKKIFDNNLFTNASIHNDLTNDGKITVETDDSFTGFKYIKMCDDELQSETYFTIKDIHVKEGVFFFGLTFDFELAACNIDCACYCSGTCPFHKKMECGRVRSKIDELKAYARVTYDKEVRV